MSSRSIVTIDSLSTFIEFVFIEFVLNAEENKEQDSNYYRGEPEFYELRNPSLYLNEKLTVSGSEKYYKTLFNELGMDTFYK